MLRAPHYRWDELPIDAPLPQLSRQRVIGERAMISRVRLEAGCFVATHAHENEQITIVERGELEFGIGQPGATDYYTVRVCEGELLHLPSNVPHSARALEATLVLDIFAPPSQGTGIDALGKARSG